MDQESRIPQVKDKFNAQVEKISENSRLQLNYNYSEGLSATIASFGFIFVKTTGKERSLNCLDFSKLPCAKFRNLLKFF